MHKSAMADCAKVQLAAGPSDGYTCDDSGCWDENEKGWTWEDIDIADRCNHPDSGEACSDPANQANDQDG